MSLKINLRKLTTRIVKDSTMSKGKKHLSVEYEKDASSPVASMTLKAEPTNRAKNQAKNRVSPVNASALASAKKIKFVPKNYEEILKKIREMRQSNPAPVDTMGCEKCHDDTADDKTKRFQILISLMLSAQTKDEATFAACQRLKTIGLNPEVIAAAEISDLEKLLMPVSFYKTKAKHIKQASQVLVDAYGCDIPNTPELLMKLPGVGPKMAHICMNSAWNIVSGIGVDVHVHRIANRLNWVSKPTTDPEKTRQELESWLPYELWSEINLMLVGFGQTTCLAKSPKCADCSIQKLCPSAFKESPKKKNTKK